VVLPADLRRRLGLAAGAKLEVSEESDGVRLRLLRHVRSADVQVLAGMIKLPRRGNPRRLDEFDAASMLRRESARRR
jgi:bifunctional DNA-binding transcriptional regulator/antitoxin component of YhaV-PrlF toxin-antitoxin module